MKPSDQARWQGSVDSWLAQGSVFDLVVNPLINSILIDTGQLAGGWYDIRILASGTVAYISLIAQHRNAANNDSLHVFFVGSGLAIPSHQNIINWKVENNERIRLFFATALTGTFTGSLHWVKRV